MVVVRDLYRNGLACGFLVAGGLLYTAGAVIFALERPRLKFRWFGPHELFHLFVMGGSLCHYITIAGCVA